MPDTASSITKLGGVHPRLVAIVTRILYAMNELGHALIVTDGWRSAEMQAALYAKGRTAPGKIVTRCDGIKSKSNHQAKADGYGYAVDLCFLADGKPSWAETHPWTLLGEMAKSQGLIWGGDFKRIVDKPHLEMPEYLP